MTVGRVLLAGIIAILLALGASSTASANAPYRFVFLNKPAGITAFFPGLEVNEISRTSNSGSKYSFGFYGR